MNCEDCDSEIPLDSEESLKNWLMEQKKQRMMDEFILGTSFSCGTCGCALPADEVIATPKSDKQWVKQQMKNSPDEVYGKSIINQLGIPKVLVNHD